MVRAAALAKDIGVELRTVETDELEDPNFVVNQADRCFHCKSHLCRTLLEIARLRAERATLLGFPDHATYQISENVAKTPAAAKGLYVKSVTVSSTMGPGVPIDPNLYRRA